MVKLLNFLQKVANCLSNLKTVLFESCRLTKYITFLVGPLHPRETHLHWSREPLQLVYIFPPQLKVVQDASTATWWYVAFQLEHMLQFPGVYTFSPTHPLCFPIRAPKVCKYGSWPVLDGLQDILWQI